MFRKGFAQYRRPNAPDDDPMKTTRSGFGMLVRVQFSTAFTSARPPKCMMPLSTPLPTWMSPVQYDIMTIVQFWNGLPETDELKMPLKYISGVGSTWSFVPPRHCQVGTHAPPPS
eukprot:Pompholyxophrys_punicea_v1_NODE_119_length_3359_cov_12.851998.p3 type:complete len:115 gc:universal NODE_119_length_3359_cov_12.851998:2380-2036(-)